MSVMEQLGRGLAFALIILLTVGFTISGFEDHPVHAVAAAIVIAAWLIRDGMAQRPV